MNKLELNDTGIVLNGTDLGNLHFDRWVHHELEELFSTQPFNVTLVSGPPKTDGWAERMPVFRDLTEDTFISVYRAAKIRGWIHHTALAADIAMRANKPVPFADGVPPADKDDLLLWVNHNPETNETTYALVY